MVVLMLVILSYFCLVKYLVTWICYCINLMHIDLHTFAGIKIHHNAFNMYDHFLNSITVKTRPLSKEPYE